MKQQLNERNWKATPKKSHKLRPAGKEVLLLSRTGWDDAGFLAAFIPCVGDVKFCLETFTMAEDPKAIAAGKPSTENMASPSFGGKPNAHSHPVLETVHIKNQ